MWGYIISAAGLILTLIGSVWKVSAVITKNTEAVNALREKVVDITSLNDREHKQFRQELEQHDDKLADHETRISVLEHQ
jgi:hypothetical protein